MTKYFVQWFIVLRLLYNYKSSVPVWIELKWKKNHNVHDKKCVNPERHSATRGQWGGASFALPEALNVAYLFISLFIYCFWCFIVGVYYSTFCCLKCSLFIKSSPRKNITPIYYEKWGKWNQVGHAVPSSLFISQFCNTFLVCCILLLFIIYYSAVGWPFCQDGDGRAQQQKHGWSCLPAASNHITQPLKKKSLLSLVLLIELLWNQQFCYVWNHVCDLILGWTRTEAWSLFIFNVQFFFTQSCQPVIRLSFWPKRSSEMFQCVYVSVLLNLFVLLKQQFWPVLMFFCD